MGFRLALILLLAGPIAAEAAVKAGPPVMGAHHRLRVPSGGGGTAPVGMPTPAVAYSFRQLLGTADPLKAARIRRASDNAEQDIGFSGSNFDTTAATAFCAATTCFVTTMYDQTLTRRNAVQAGAGNQPELVFSCLGAFPCLRTTIGTSQNLASGTYTPSSTVMSMNGVARRTVGTASCYVVSGGLNNRIQHTNGSAGFTLLANAGVVTSAAGATENVWHSVTGILNGAASSLVWDTTTATGTGTATVSLGSNTISQGAGTVTTTCNEVEAIWWDATALTAQQAADLNANQKTYFGF